ncbi:MAG: CcmD family protein [Bacteroidota bacterium]
MNKLLQRISFTLLALLLTTMVSAQNTGGQTDIMRSNGKIYVVMAVVITIVAGLFIYVASLDRKISKLEKSK